MIIVRYVRNEEQQDLFYAATRKDLPALMETHIAGSQSLETVIERCQFCEFNSKDMRLGTLTGWQNLSEVLKVTVKLDDSD